MNTVLGKQLGTIFRVVKGRGGAWNKVREVFKTSSPGLNDIKLFCQLFMLGYNKLERLKLEDFHLRLTYTKEGNKLALNVI